MPKLHNIVYDTENIVNGKVYRGIHSTNNLEDGYLGTGMLIKQAIDKYGKDNFNKEILFDFDNEKDMYNEEEKIVTEDFVQRKDTYNLTLGGRGTPHSKEIIMKISNSCKGRTP